MSSPYRQLDVEHDGERSSTGTVPASEFVDRSLGVAQRPPEFATGPGAIFRCRPADGLGQGKAHDAALVAGCSDGALTISDASIEISPADCHLGEVVQHDRFSIQLGFGRVEHRSGDIQCPRIIGWNVQSRQADIGQQILPFSPGA